MANRFWVGGTGTWDSTTTANWSTTTGGASGASVPGASDAAIFDSGSGTVTVTTNYAASVQNVTLSGTSTLVLGNSLTTSANINLTGGTFNSVGNTVSCDTLTKGAGTVTLTLGASAITCTGANKASWSVVSVGVTITANTATVTLSGTSATASGANNYNGTSFVMSGGGTMAFNGTNTVSNLTVTGVGATDSLSILNGSTISGTLTLTGNSLTNRLLVQTTVLGTSKTLTAAAVSLTNVDFMDIAGGGAAAPFTGTSLGDCQGNSNITFTTAVTRYAVVAGNWSSTATWSSSSGGAGGSSVPLPQDAVILDSSSGAGTYTANMPRLGKDISCTGFTRTLSISSTSNTIFGNLTLAAGMTFTNSSGPFTFGGRGSQTITNAGQTWAISVNINAPSGTYTLQDASNYGGGVTLTNGTINTNGTACSWASFTCAAAATKTLTLGASVLTLTGTGTVFLVTTGFVINPGTSTIVISDTSSTAKTFNGGAGRTFNNLSITGGGTGAVTITGINIFNVLTIGAPKTVTLPASTTTTISNFVAVGSSGNVITLQSSTGGTAATLSQASGTVSCDYLSIQDSTATGGASWYAGTHSTNVSGNTGWTFSSPASIKTIAPGGGNWSATTTWVEAAVPASTDDVVALASGGSGQLTIDATASARSMDLTGYTNTLTHNSAITLSLGSTTTNGSLSMKFVSAMTYTLGNVATSAISFVSTSGTQEQITSAAKILGNVTFNGVGGSWLLADGFTTGTTATVTLTNGTLNTNGQTNSWGLFSSSNTNTRTLTLGASAVTITGTGGPWSVAVATSFTMTANTATITFTGNAAIVNHGGAPSFNGASLVMTGSGAAGVQGTSITVNNFTRTGTAVKTDGLQISVNITATGTLTLTGNSLTNRMYVQSTANLIGTSHTLTAAAVSLTNVDFQDIAGAGAAAPFTGTSLGDALGNSGITFTTTVTQTWSGNTTGNWSTAANWTSRVPLPQDNVSINALTSGTVTVDMPRAGANIDLTGSTGGTVSPSIGIVFFGNLKFVSGVAAGGASTWTGSGRGSQTLTNAGVTLSALNISAPSGTYALQDALTLASTHTLTISAGTFDANGQNVSVGLVSSGTGLTRTINLGTGTWTLTGTGSVWGTSLAGLTVNPSTSTIIISDTSSSSKTFASTALTYNNLSITGGGTGAVTITGSNTFNSFSIGAPKTVTFTHGTTQTVSSFGAVGSSGNVITLNSDSAGNAWTLSKASGTVSSDYLSLQDSTATGGASWFAGTHSTNVSNNTGWTFSYPANVKTISPVGGNYSATTAWVEGTVPAATDAVGAMGTSGALTIDTNAATCLTFDMTSYTSTLTHTAAVTFTVAGSKFLLVSGMTYTLGNATTSALAFTQSTAGTVAITTGGKTLGNVTTASGLSSSSATYQLQDTNTIGSTATWTHNTGTLDTNSQAVSWGIFSTSNSNTRTLTLGSSAITISGVGTAWTIATITGMTVTANTATVTVTGSGPTFVSGNLNYNGMSLNFTGSGVPTMSSGCTFTNLTRTGTALKTDGLTFSVVASTTTTITGALTLTGNSLTNRLIVQTGTQGTTATLALGTTGTSSTNANVDFMDIAVTGTNSPLTGTSLGDCQGNSGITFTTAATQTWAGTSSDNWSTNAWTTRVPLPQDNVVISSAFSASQTIAVDMPRIGKNIDFTGVSGAPTWSSNVGSTLFGNLTLAAGMTPAGSSVLAFKGRGLQTVTMAGKTLSPFGVIISAPGGTYTMQDDWSSVNISLRAGTFTANGHNVTLSTGYNNNSSVIAPTLNMGTGTWTLTGTGTVWNYSSGTINQSTSTIVISDTSSTAKTFAGGGLTYNNLSITGGGTGAVTITGSNTFNQLSIGPPKTVTFTHATTQTVSSFVAMGGSGSIITINSDSVGNKATLSSASGPISCDYLAIKDSNATGGARWNAGNNSTDNGDNTGWIFGGDSKWTGWGTPL